MIRILRTILKIDSQLGKNASQTAIQTCLIRALNAGAKMHGKVAVLNVLYWLGFYLKFGMVWYGNNLFDITEIHNTLL